MYRKPVRVLHMYLPRGKTEHVADKFVSREGAGNKAAFTLDHHHEIGRIFLVAFSPDGALQRLGGKKFAEAGEHAQ